jgi:hypothetical protein
LLVVILIISILASLILGVAAIAGETARQAGTKHTVQRLHQLLTEFYGTFKTRRVRLRPDSTLYGNGIETQVRKQFADGIRQGQALAEARLYAMREIMLMDVPDRWSDVILEPVGSFSTSASPIVPFYLDGRTELSNVYYRRFLQIFNATNSKSGVKNTAAEIVENQGAECLYMVIMTACGDGESRTLFGEHLIGDTDGDGAPEFLDGWGHPIEFLRWAPGFDSQIQTNANSISTQADWQKAAAADHDPFDLFRTDLDAFRLVPLIFAAGRDESLGIEADPTLVIWPVVNQKISFNNSNPPYIAKPVLTPFIKTSGGNYMGTSLHLIDTKIDETSTDNIHNHLLGLR